MALSTTSVMVLCSQAGSGSGKYNVDYNPFNLRTLCLIFSRAKSLRTVMHKTVLQPRPTLLAQLLLLAYLLPRLCTLPMPEDELLVCGEP
jgi:hypothetical protein